MTSDDGEDSTEGYLYSFGVSKEGGIYCVLTFCILTGRRFAQLRHKGDQVSLRSGVLDANHRVEDTGRQLVNGKLLYTIRLYSTSDYAKEVLLGSPSAEEAAEWMKAFISGLRKHPLSVLEPWTLAEHPEMSSAVVAAYEPKQPALPAIRSSRVAPILQRDTPDSQPPPKWKLVRCENGLRFFEEICSDSKLPVMKAVGVVKGLADHIFDEVMNYGPERFQWDHTMETASIVEIVDGHSDVVHICLRKDWRWMKPRDFCISRYWKREDNGSFTIFYRSISKHPVQAGHIRGTIHSGGYIITPLNTRGKPKSLVECVFEMDVGGWPSWVGPGVSGYPFHLRNSLLSVIAGIREYFAAQRLNSCSSSSISYTQHTVELPTGPEETITSTSTPFLETDLIEDFFDARADQLSDSSEGHGDLTSPRNKEVHSNSARVLEKEFSLSRLAGSLAKGPPVNGHNTYAEPECENFKVRGKDGSLAPPEDVLFNLVAVDWYKSEGPLDDVSSRRSIVQEAPSKDLFFFTFNLQVPHSGHFYNLIFYFATKRKIREGTLLHSFIHETDEFRNERLVLLPTIPEGSWIVRQAVGSRAVVLGQILECSYHRGSNYIEVDVNMGSSGIVRGVMGIVFGYMSALVVDMGFSLRAENEEELPEQFLGAVRCSRVDLSRASTESIQ